jgi:hypothetical protein
MFPFIFTITLKRELADKLSSKLDIPNRPTVKGNRMSPQSSADFGFVTDLNCR